MILRTSLSNTKKFFQNTIKSFKSLFSGSKTYQRLPKTPPFKPFSCIGRCSSTLDESLSETYRELDKFYAEFSNRIDSQINNMAMSKRISTLSARESELCSEDYHVETRDIVHSGIAAEEEISSTCRGDNVREVRRCLVEEKLKELEIMDLSNELDIEEALHYYSLLTCPVYMDIFDKFFVGIYSELFNLQAILAHHKTSSTSRPTLLQL